MRAHTRRRDEVTESALSGTRSRDAPDARAGRGGAVLMMTSSMRDLDHRGSDLKYGMCAPAQHSSRETRHIQNPAARGLHLAALTAPTKAGV